MVVVDSFSTDRTAEICAEFGVRFVQHPFGGHIEQKNHALSLAAYPHVLSLDADEALTPELAQRIGEIKQNWSADGYGFHRLTYYCGHWVRHGGWYPDAKLRLWDKRRGQWGGVNPHDKVVMAEGVRIERIPLDLLHYSYYSIAQHFDQFNKFTTIGAREAVAAGKKASWSDLLIRPYWKFWRDFVIKGGFLDGYYGFVIAMISAHATFIKYVKIRELWKNQTPRSS